MKGLATAIGAIALIGTPAFAADMPVKAPPSPPPAPVYTWTGWYAGLNFGGAWGSNNRGVDNSVTSGSCVGFSAPLGCNELFAAIAGSTPAQLDFHSSGPIGGGQIGYNWQFNNWVAGVEADFQGANISGSNSLVGPSLGLADFSDIVTVSGTASQKINWLGTVRARLGWLPFNPLFLYATGGLAYGHIETNVSFSVTDPQSEASGSTSLSQSDTRAGWTVGGGLEFMLAPQWSFKAEYLFYDLGHVNVTQALPLISTIPGNVLFSNISSDTHVTGNIVRIGLNYQFH